MSTEYNSKLIASLYEETDKDRIIEISEEMTDTLDPIFIQPLFSAYKKLKTSSASLYFPSFLVKFKTPESLEILKKIASDPTSSESDIIMMIDYLAEVGYFEESFIERIKQFLLTSLINKDDGYDVESFLSYLSKANRIDFIIDVLKDVFEDDDQKNRTREVSLRYILRNNPKENIKYYYDNYEAFIDKRAEIILVKEICTWKNGIIENFKQKIREKGSTRAKEILDLSEGKDKKSQDKDNEQKNKLVELKYTNADVVVEVSKLRKKINSITSTDERFGFPIFISSESISEQNESATSKTSLVGHLIELRTLLQAVPDEILSINFTEEEISKIFPGITKLEDGRQSINKLHLFLSRVGIDVDHNIFGLRALNQIVTATAHPDDNRTDLITLLRKYGLSEAYEAENWSKLHRQILEKYKDYLNAMFDSINAERKP